jgi:hypothetical protein
MLRNLLQELCLRQHQPEVVAQEFARSSKSSPSILLPSTIVLGILRAETLQRELIPGENSGTCPIWATKPRFCVATPVAWTFLSETLFCKG